MLLLRGEKGAYLVVARSGSGLHRDFPIQLACSCARYQWLPVAIRHRPIRDAMTYRVNMTASGAHVCE